MDDFFGGPIRTESLSKDFESAHKLFKDLIIIGAITNTCMNLKKSEEPSRSKDILGMNFNSKEKACFLASSKVTKYKSRLVNLRKLEVASSKELQKSLVLSYTLRGLCPSTDRLYPTSHTSSTSKTYTRKFS